MAYWASYIGFGFEKEECEKLLTEVRKKLSMYNDKIAWHNPEYMHLTLQFLGWTKDSDINKLKIILQKEKINNVNFKLNGKLVLLGFDEKKEYIAMRVEQTKELVQYRNLLGTKMEEQGITFKKQDFLSHISLGRIYNLNEIEDKEFFIPRILQAKGVYVYESISESNTLVGVNSKELLKQNIER